MNNIPGNIPTTNNDKLFSLNRVIGLGCNGNFSISSNKRNGLTAWITGPYAVLYDIKKDKQVKFFKNKNNKVFTCLTFNDEGTILACGEGNCKNSEVILFDINQEETTIKAALKGHKFGIEKLKFFRNDKFLLTIGDREDKSMFIFNLNSNVNEVIFTSKYNRPILSFDICDNFLVLGGAQFLKIWNIEDSENKKLLISKTNVDTGKLKEKNFTSCVIYVTLTDKRVLILTSDGHLAEMKQTTKQLARWVHLKTDKGITMCLYDQMLVCGCGDGIIRIFKADTLEHLVTLHRPPPLGRANIDPNIKKINISVTNDEKFADVVTLCYNNYYEKLISIYSDKTFFVWDVKKTDKIFVDRYNAFHSGSINNMDVQETKDNILRIVTCSDDKTVKLWNFRMEDFIPLDSSNIKNPLPISVLIPSTRKLSHIAYSKIIRRIFYFGKNFNHFKFNMDAFISASGSSSSDNKYENPRKDDFYYNEDDNDNIEITAVRFSPDEKYAAFGDNFGNLYIYNLETFEQVNFASAHNAQISSIDFIITSSKQYLLATGSCDNLINVIDIAIGIEQDFENYERSVLCDHQAPVTNVLFCIDKLNQTKLISCSADRCIIFFLVTSASSIQIIQKFQEDDISTYCLALNPANNQIIAGHNGRVTIWKTKMCVIDKIYKMKKGENLLDNFRMAVDKTGSIFAISNNDKYIRIRSTKDGQLITKIPIAESISSIVFSLNNNFLIASSVEGYIYFFKIDQEGLPLKMRTPSPEKLKMKNKLKLLQKFMKDDVNFSKNDRVKALIEKMKNSEDVKLEDLKMFDSHLLDNKNKGGIDNNNNIFYENDQDIQNESELIKFVNQIDFLTKTSEEDESDFSKLVTQNVKTGNSEVIELKEEKAVNEEEEDESKGENLSNKNVYLNRSTIFEKNLKEVSPDAMKKSILNRVSLTDTYYKKKHSGDRNEIYNEPKDNKENNEIMYIPKNQVVENIFKKASLNDHNRVIPKNEKIIKIENIEKTEKIEKLEKLFKLEKIEKLEKIVKLEKIEKIEKLDKIDKLENFLKIDKIGKIEKIDKIEIIEKNEDFIINNRKKTNPTKADSKSESNPIPEVKTNNFVNKNNSDKNTLKENNNSNTNISNSNTTTVNELQQLISDTSKYVDTVENRVNSSTDLINKNSIKKEKEEDYDYFTNENRLSYVKGVNLNQIPKANNIFKKNLHEVLTTNENDSIIINNKFNNVTNEEKNYLDEIIEDLQQDDLSKVKICSTLQTQVLEVNDTLVLKDKIGDVNTTGIYPYNTLMYSQSTQSHFLNDTNITGTTNFNISNMTEIINSGSRSNFQANYNKNNVIQNLQANSVSFNKNDNRKKIDCVKEKFSFSLNTDNANINNCEKNKIGNTLSSEVSSQRIIENLENFNKYLITNGNNEKPEDLMRLRKLMLRTTETLENKLKGSGHLIEQADPIMDKYLDKYSQLLVAKIEERLNNKKDK